MAIARALPFLLNLESLYLSEDSIDNWDDKSTTALAKALPLLTKLRTFVFSRAWYGDSKTENTTIKLISALVSVPTLTHLDLSYNRIGEKGGAEAAALAQVLPSMKHLKTLDLRFNPLGTSNSTSMNALLDSLSPLLCQGTTIYTQNTGLSLVPWSQASVDLQAHYSTQIQKACEDHQCFGTPVESSNVTCAASSSQKKEGSSYRQNVRQRKDFYPSKTRDSSLSFDRFDDSFLHTSAASSLSPSFIFRLFPHSWKRQSLSLPPARLSKDYFVKSTNKEIVLFERASQPVEEREACSIKDEFLPSPFALFTMSVTKGALTTLVPEITRDMLTQWGAPQSVVHVGSSVVQMGMLLYTTTSYLPTAIGMATHKGLTYVGASAEVAIGIGNTAAIVTSLASGDVVTPTNLIVSMGGSIVGSTLAIKAKNKVYSWFNSKPVQKVKSKVKSSWNNFCDFLDCFEG